MKRIAKVGMAILALSLASEMANAFTAIAYSASAERGGSSKNAPTKEAAISDAIDQCKKNGGGSDCKVFKVTDELGFVALYATCAKTCGVTAVTGRATAELARIDGKRDCEAHFKNPCQLAQEWEETVGSGSKLSAQSLQDDNNLPKTTEFKSDSDKNKNTNASMQRRSVQVEPLGELTITQLLKGAESGDVNYQFELYRRYWHGIGVKEDRSGSADWLIKAADGGHPQAQVEMAKLLRGYGRYERAVNYLEMAAAKGNAEAEFVLGMAYKDGQGRTKDINEFKKLIESSARKGYAPAQSYLGIQYMNGTEGYPERSDSAFSWLLKAAENGYKDVYGLVGYFYFTGSGTALSWEKSAYWYEKSLGSGDNKQKESAEEYLKKIYSSGMSTIKTDSLLWGKAVTLAGQGDSAMERAIAYHYCDKKNSDSDILTCEKWLEKAAAKGDAKAQTHLAYANVYGVRDSKNRTLPLDYTKAIRWFELAAKQGDSGAMYGLGLTYGMMETASIKGGGSNSLTEGYKNLSRDWLRKAAAKGDMDAKQKLCERFRESCN